MGAVSEILGSEAKPHPLPAYKDRPLFIKKIDQAVRSSFENTMFERAKKAEMMMRDARTYEDYSAKLDAIVVQYRRGEFGLLSQGGMEYFGTMAGATFIAHEIVIHEDGSNASEEEIFWLLVVHQDEMLRMVRLVLRESFPFDVSAKPAGKNGAPLSADEELAAAKAKATADSAAISKDLLATGAGSPK